MDTQSTDQTVENVSLSDMLSLATWNRPRTTQELRNFVNTRYSNIAGLVELD